MVGIKKDIARMNYNNIKNRLKGNFKYYIKLI